MSFNKALTTLLCPIVIITSSLAYASSSEHERDLTSCIGNVNEMISMDCVDILINNAINSNNVSLDDRVGHKYDLDKSMAGVSLVRPLYTEFAPFDTNKDGQITSNEWSVLIDTFNIMSANSKDSKDVRDILSVINNLSQEERSRGEDIIKTLNNNRIDWFLKKYKTG